MKRLNNKTIDIVVNIILVIVYILCLVFFVYSHLKHVEEKEFEDKITHEISDEELREIELGQPLN